MNLATLPTTTSAYPLVGHGICMHLTTLFTATYAYLLVGHGDATAGIGAQRRQLVPGHLSNTVARRVEPAHLYPVSKYGYLEGCSLEWQ